MNNGATYLLEIIARCHLFVAPYAKESDSMNPLEQ